VSHNNSLIKELADFFSSVLLSSFKVSSTFETRSFAGIGNAPKARINF